MTPARNILAVVTTAGNFETVGFRTGLWLGELVEFYDVADNAGYKVDIASPDGGRVPIDPESLMLTQIGDSVGVKSSVLKKYEDKAFMQRLDETMKVSDVDVAAYDAIFLAGGHGTMYDFVGNAALSNVIGRFYEDGKVVAAVCHGPCGLLDVTLSTGQHLLEGRKVTGFSWNEEIAAKRADAVPFNLEEELQKRGAEYSKALIPFKTHVVEDERLITGQNPISSRGVGKAVVTYLEAHR